MRWKFQMSADAVGERKAEGERLRLLLGGAGRWGIVLWDTLVILEHSLALSVLPLYSLPFKSMSDCE